MNNDFVKLHIELILKLFVTLFTFILMAKSVLEKEKVLNTSRSSTWNINIE